MLVELTQRHIENLDPLKHGSIIKINVKKVNFHSKIWWGTLEYINVPTEKKMEKHKIRNIKHTSV